MTWHVAMKPGRRRLLPDTPLGQLLEKVEQAKASVRAKVERPFHVVKNLFKYRKARYRGLAKNTAQLLTLFGLANLMLAIRHSIALHAQGANARLGTEKCRLNGQGSNLHRHELRPVMQA